ncbi:hypothetical protein ACQ7CS_25080 [Escherichia coli]|uniref:hypothetical protein n=1 Tax=Escherichia coli TaxID=562 RepID=UPI003D332DFC
MKSAILWRISRLSFLGGQALHLTRAAETGDTRQAVKAACRPRENPWQADACRKGSGPRLARRPLPFQSVMCLTQDVFLSYVMELFLMLLFLYLLL